jgi:transcriptional/translational regulatory protein YebC/TACO1
MSRGGGNIGSQNSVAWMFDKKAQMSIDATKVSEEKALEAAMEAGAEDIARDGDVFVVTTEPAAFHAVKDAIEARGIGTTDAESLVMIPKNTVKVEGATAEQLLKLLEALEEMDDVQKVWANFDIDVADMANAG